jgi:hypothetical protein
MKKVIGMAALMVVAAAMAFAPRATAQCNTGTGQGLLFQWGSNGFAYETNYTPATYTSAVGSQLTLVGVITLWCAPFNSLDPNDPAKEYTFVITGTSNGTGTSPLPGGGTKYTTVYTGGSFSVYEGTPRNAPSHTAMPASPPNATVPGNYQDGTLILSGPVDSLTTTINRLGTGQVTGSFRGKYQASGGSLFGQLCQNVGTGLMTGSWNVAAGAVPTGYSANVTGKFDAPNCPTGAYPSTWGKIKSLYR